MQRVIFAMVLSLLLFVGNAFAGVNVNTASQGELEGLPGIGPSKATAIIDFRTKQGAFESLADLDKVPGIGPATLDNLRPLVEFGGDAVPAKASSGDAPSSKASSGPRININSASQKELESLPGIGPSKAASIVGDREAKGSFASCSALARVNGIGQATVKALAEQCTAD